MDKIVEGVHGFQGGDFQQDKEFFEALAKGQSPTSPDDYVFGFENRSKRTHTD